MRVIDVVQLMMVWWRQRPCLGHNGIHNSLVVVVVVVVPFAVPFLSSFFLAVLFLIFCAFGCVDGRFACFPAVLQRGSATRQLRLVRRSLSLSHTHTQCCPSYCIVVTQVYIKYNSEYITVGELAIQCVCVCVLCVYILDMEVVGKEREASDDQ